LKRVSRRGDRVLGASPSLAIPARGLDSVMRALPIPQISRMDDGKRGGRTQQTQNRNSRSAVVFWNRRRSQKQAGPTSHNRSTPDRDRIVHARELRSVQRPSRWRCLAVRLQRDRRPHGRSLHERPRGQLRRSSVLGTGIGVGLRPLRPVERLRHPEFLKRRIEHWSDDVQASFALGSPHEDDDYSLRRANSQSVWSPPF